MSRDIYPGYGPFVQDRKAHVLIQHSAGFDLKRRFEWRKRPYPQTGSAYLAPEAWEICRNGIFFGWVTRKGSEWFYTLPNGERGWIGPFRSRRDAVIARSKAYASPLPLPTGTPAREEGR